MRRLITLLIACAITLVPGVLLAQNGKGGKDKKDHAGRDEPVMTPELAAFKKEIESWPSDKLRQTIATEKKSLEEWARKNNFDPPGNEYDRDKGKGGAGKRGKGGKGKVAISKRKEAELMAQFVPWKAKIDVMEQVLREHDNPKKDGKDARPKKEK